MMRGKASQRESTKSTGRRQKTSQGSGYRLSRCFHRLETERRRKRKRRGASRAVFVWPLEVSSPGEACRTGNGEAAGFSLPPLEKEHTAGVYIRLSRLTSNKTERERKAKRKKKRGRDLTCIDTVVRRPSFPLLPWITRERERHWPLFEAEKGRKPDGEKGEATSSPFRGLLCAHRGRRSRRPAQPERWREAKAEIDVASRRIKSPSTPGLPRVNLPLSIFPSSYLFCT